MPASPLKRRCVANRLLASFPVQTGFPTSLADLVVKNHARLRNPRRRHRLSAASPSPAPPSAAEPLAALPQQRREVFTIQNAVVRPKGAAFSIRPELLAVALALLVIWSKWLVAAVAVASVALSWIESIRSSASRWRPRPETVSCGRGLRVSPIREEVESEARTPRSSSDRGSEVSPLWAADDSIAPNPKRKEKRRSLRKLIAQKLRHGKGSKYTDTTTTAGSNNHPDAGPVIKTEAPLPALAMDTTPPDATTDDNRCAFPLAALVPIILVGLVAGKLPAVALTVLCAVFFSIVEGVPATSTC